jgi:S-adenosylhomocysteine hydrolase
MKIPKFKILDFLNSVFENINLKDCHVICVQHIVASTISLFNALFENGLNSQNLSAIGKCYSTRPEALEHLHNRKVDVARESLHFDPYRAFDVEFKRILLSFFRNKIKSLEAKGCKKLIVLDDGGKLLLCMNSLLKRSKFWKGKVVGIEQTTAGYEKLKSEPLLLPIINVARSNIKLFHESPFIARVAVERLLEHLNKLRVFPKSALIIGNGAVGSHIHAEIRELFRTETFDLDASKSSIHTDSYAKMLGNFDLIIGCTGKTVIHPNQFRLLKKGACLASVSSSDREFSGFNLRNKIKNIPSCHEDICARGIHLLNCGFPINFDNAYEEIDIPEFQLTRAILLAGIYQSITKEYANGLIDLDSDLQAKIYHLYNHAFLPTGFDLAKS